MDQLLTAQSLTSLGYVGGMLTAALVVANVYLPKHTSAKNKFIFVWLAFDAICHFTLEGSFLYLSVCGRTVNSSKGFFATTWQEYAKADARWGTADVTVVAIEILTVLGAGPAAAYICYQMLAQDPAYNYWIVVLSTAEIYGGFMTFAPEWLSHSLALNTSNWLFKWVYLALMNLLWVFVPLWLMYDSYIYIARTLRAAAKRPLAEQTKDQRTARAASAPRLFGLGAYLVVFIVLFISMVPTARAAEVPAATGAGASKHSHPLASDFSIFDTSLGEVLVPIMLPLALLSLSLFVGIVQVAESSIRKTKRTNRNRRRKLLAELGIDEKAEVAKGAARRTILGIFHPYCNAGGGGERVLYEAISQHQKHDPRLVIVVYTGDFPGASKAEILSKARQRFGIDVNADTIAMVGLKNRKYVDDGYWRRLTLLGQSYGSVVLAFEAMGAIIPDVYVDTMGYAFTFPVVRLFNKTIPIGAYVHYPTISTDMLRRVEQREAGHTNDAKVAASVMRSKAKLYYYRAFAWLYSWALRRANRVVVNGTWTRNHINSLIGSDRRAEIVYPPCDTRSMNSFGLSGRSRTVVSLAQFRPEKEHPQQVKIMRALLDQRPDLSDVKLIMMGSSRNESDEKRITLLRLLIEQLGLSANVELIVNAPYAVVLEKLAEASVGLSTMVDEHFGINVVEFMAAGLVTLSHASAGPLMDIAVAVEGKKTGFHASSLDEFARMLAQIMDMGEKEAVEIRTRARRRAVETFGSEGFWESWMKQLWLPLMQVSAAEPQTRGAAQEKLDEESRKER